MLRAVRWRFAYAWWYVGWRMMLALADHRDVHGIRVRASRLFDEETNKRALDMVESALRLVAEFDPRRMRRLGRDVEWIWIKRTGYGTAYFAQAMKMCVIDREYLTRADTTSARVAATLVHEAAHARLFARNIPYDEPQRARIEAFCYAQAADFARKLPDGQSLAQRILATQPTAPDWSTETLDRRESESRQIEYDAELRDVEGADLPRWLKRVLGSLIRSRAARGARNSP